jgi:cyclic pyranopterin monophosphate synthase
MLVLYRVYKDRLSENPKPCQHSTAMIVWYADGTGLHQHGGVGVGGFTHFDEEGRPRMVDVSDKQDTDRVAVAQAVVDMSVTTRQKIERADIGKGDVIRVAEIAGIMAAKRTAEWIPLCHPLPLTEVSVEIDWIPSPHPDRAFLRVQSTAKTIYRTGVEMEALTACTAAALTVYDMCKSVDRGMSMQDVRLLFKSGGKSGVYHYDPGSR